MSCCTIKYGEDDTMIKRLQISQHHITLGLRICTFFSPQKDTLCKNANTNTKRCSGDETLTANVQDETYRWNLQRENCVQVWTKPHVTYFFPKALSNVHGINRGHLMEMIHLINMIHSPVNVANSRSNVSPPSWPWSFHLWKATRRFNLDLESDHVFIFRFCCFIAALLIAFFSWAAADI